MEVSGSQVIVWGVPLLLNICKPIKSIYIQSECVFFMSAFLSSVNTKFVFLYYLHIIYSPATDM